MFFWGGLVISVFCHSTDTSLFKKFYGTNPLFELAILKLQDQLAVNKVCFAVFQNTFYCMQFKSPLFLPLQLQASTTLQGAFKDAFNSAPQEAIFKTIQQ